MKTLQDVQTEFRAKGIAISKWAEKNGFDKNAVYAVVAGRNQGIRGDAHEIAVKLGLKPDPQTKEENK